MSIPFLLIPSSFLAGNTTTFKGVDLESMFWWHLQYDKPITKDSLCQLSLSLKEIPDPFRKWPYRPSSFFHLAIEKGCAPAVQMLIDFSVENGSLFEVLTGTYGADETTPLHKACETGHANVIKLLLDAGSLLLLPELHSELLPLSLAIKSQKYEAVEVILKHAENLGILQEVLNQLSGFKGLNALHEACIQKDISIILLLLQTGASLFIPSAGGYYPLYFAVQTQNHKGAKMILQFAEEQKILFDVLNQKNGPEGLNAISIAHIVGDIQMIALLRLFGATDLPLKAGKPQFPNAIRP